MGKVADRDIYKTKTGPTTGPGLNGLSENQGAFRETLGALPPKDVTILDGAITGFEEAALIVDTEGGGAADDLEVISDVISATEKLHPGMLITLRAKDPARVVTVKNSVSPNGINTADGNDIVLSTAWELTLRLVGGRWYEVPGRASAQAAAALSAADAAQSTADAAKAVTNLVTPTPTAHAVPQADGDGKLDAWVSLAGKANNDLSNLEPAADEVIRSKMTLRNLGTRTTTGNWTLTDVKVGVPMYIGLKQTVATDNNGARMRVVSGSDIGTSPDTVGYFIGLNPSYISSNVFLIKPTGNEVVVSVGAIGSGCTLYAEQI